MCPHHSISIVIVILAVLSLLSQVKREVDNTLVLEGWKEDVFLIKYVMAIAANMLIEQSTALTKPYTFGFSLY